jgi:hypothetical protein
MEKRFSAVITRKDSSSFFIFLTFITVFTCIVLPSVHAGTIYRWLGNHGVVNYGASPPAGAHGVHLVSGESGGSDRLGTPNVIPPVKSGNAATSIPAAHSTPPAVSSASVTNKKRMQSELTMARLALLQAARNYEQGKAIRTGNERNYARYLARINGLKQNMKLAQLHVLLIQRKMKK